MSGEIVAGKYLVEEVLGTGGMAVVLRVRHVELRRKMALKMPRPDRVATPTETERFLREARAAARLTSEHACRVLDLGTTERGVPFLVMELLQGESVARRVGRGGPMPVAEAVRYVCEACDALDEAHALGFVHRDIKPANLFLMTGRGGQSTLKLLDFGISKVANPSLIDVQAPITMDTSMLGTPAYMAPEQIESSRSVDPRADLWALGVCLYVMTTGQRPFTGPSTLDVALAVMDKAPRPPRELRPDLPQELEQIILRCLEKDPGKRYRSAESLARALLPFAGVMTPWPPARRASELSMSEEIVVDVHAPSVLEPTGVELRVETSQAFSTDSSVSIAPSVPPPGKSARLWPRIAFGGAMIGIVGAGAVAYRQLYERAPAAPAMAPSAITTAPEPSPVVTEMSSASAAPPASAAPSSTRARPRHTTRQLRP